MRNRTEWRLGVRLLPLTAVALTAACPHYYETPAPGHFKRDQATTVPFDSIRAYAARLHFDSVLGAADVKLVNFTTGVIGPGGDSAWIEPEKGAWAVDSNELAEGRIIARIRTKTVHKPQGYGPNWWTWWWVYQDTARKAWHGVLLSDSMQTRDTEPVSREFHPLDEWKQSIARWRGSKWGTCDNRSCCSGP